MSQVPPGVAVTRRRVPACGALTLAVGVAAYALLLPGAMAYVAWVVLRRPEARPGDGWAR